MTISRHGIVATSQMLASAAGAKVLERGGSAVDAAIAANAVIGVVEPMMNGIGGDLFAIVWEAGSRKPTGINAGGGAPQNLTIEFLKRKGLDRMPETGIHSVTVPGCVDGWARLHKRFGRIPWKDLFAPAIYYADNGFPVTERIHDYWWHHAWRLKAGQGGADIFLLRGRAPAVGELFRNPQLATALKLIAGQGPSAFYQGPIAKALLATSDRLGGAMTAADLKEFESEWTEPISTNYRGWTIYELPPNTQGIAALSMLNIMENYPLVSFGPLSTEAFHVRIEAQKLAYQDLYRYVADPRFASIPIAGLLDKSYAAQRAGLIDPHRAACDPAPGAPAAGDTMYLAVVDRDGNIVSLIQSLSEAFGSAVMVDGMGFHLHNRGSGFSFDAKHSNALAPKKRPFHTIIPAFMEKGDVHIGFGIIGGPNQPQAHAQFVSYLVDHGMNVQAALDAPRFQGLGKSGCEVAIEARVPTEVRRALAAKGHRLDVRGDYYYPLGPGQAVVHDSATGINFGASSPRGDGGAVPESPPKP